MRGILPTYAIYQLLLPITACRVTKPDVDAASSGRAARFLRAIFTMARVLRPPASLGGAIWGADMR